MKYLKPLAGHWANHYMNWFLLKAGMLIPSKADILIPSKAGILIRSIMAKLQQE
jgi:hypothetical protein